MANLAAAQRCRHWAKTRVDTWEGAHPGGAVVMYLDADDSVQHVIADCYGDAEALQDELPKYKRAGSIIVDLKKEKLVLMI